MKIIVSIISSAAVIMTGLYVYSKQNVYSDEKTKIIPKNVAYHDTVCPNGTSDAGYSIQNKVVCEISNVIVNDLHLTSDKFWKIKGEVQIGLDNNYQTNLLIDEGTTIFGDDDKDFMVVNRGSKIVARGSQQKPIIFTSEKDIKNQKPESGDWGGLVLAGNAPINTGNLDEEFEFSKKHIRFGGNNAEDNSGMLKYVVIKYAGAEVAHDKELNGLSLGGVGSGTVIDYVEVYKGKDDGIEIWGGTVNMKHILLVGNRDDSLDTDLGYNGKIQYLYAEKLSLEASQSGNGIESDNNVQNFAATPTTEPILANFELLGSFGSEYGILLRHGSGYRLINGIVSSFDKAQLSIQDAQTLKNQKISFQSIALGSSLKDGDTFYGKNGVSSNEIKDIFMNSKSCAVDSYKTNASIVKETQENQFFDKAPFVGAYEKGKDWRFGWSVGSFN